MELTAAWSARSRGRDEKEGRGAGGGAHRTGGWRLSKGGGSEGTRGGELAADLRAAQRGIKEGLERRSLAAASIWGEDGGNGSSVFSCSDLREIWGEDRDLMREREKVTKMDLVTEGI
ncbi:uncharacterized protein A4U43_C10F6340 [Asparagus officinalis]|uniref:Uncharacterized protein n=1 Tax=Asparagus officinalis TaxID=4686 RepID=A0A5P1E1D7_ASPOF|nr:uncharacterized protein A4U43_C10F6340 [Asparagus officinalis]